MGLSRLPASSALLASPAIGAFAPRSRTEVLFPSLCHWIPLRGIGGGMGIISPAGELCTLGFARNRRFRAAQSN
jgi:hypothetical protein